MTSEPAPATAADLALQGPRVHPADVDLATVRAYLARPKSHLALLVDADGVLVATLDASDLPEDRTHDARPARRVGRLDGRTVAASVDAASVGLLLAERNTRRLAVVDGEGRLVGLVCRKRRSAGYCDDEGVAQLRAERHR
ncbi:hypothetical protein K8Z61_02980 [Nocardioides sp. TRM66260-LWL]|uniref:CBS domain-containing protein n=1 Tax=Nocardioides sp. TRM66260-LWL TaxID=2874478 RepID=UPI001CC60430|nr:CBS domain-containing protein [Nocardioides sp. TRM66260-LWL]MBZ5733449.1 hypothetical protein [Nocardioides sp. TRM66260-LWL]